MEAKSTISIFIDDEKQPIASFATPVNFELDTRKLTDGQHTLTIVSKDVTGKEGLRKIPFLVRNGPAVSIEGIKENDIVDGIVSLMINAYGKGLQKKFIIEGSETPQTVPSWIWILLIAFICWAIYYFVTSFSI